MKEGTRIVRPSTSVAEAELQSYLRNRWSSDLRVGKVIKVSPFHRRVIINAKRVDLIIDSRRKKRIFSCRTIENLAEFSIRPAPKKWIIEGPSLGEFLKSQERNKLGVITRSERVLVKHGYDKLVDMGIVRTALTPIENLMTWLATEGSLSEEEWRKGGRSLNQSDNYLYILGKLGLIKVEGGNIVPGPKFRGDFADQPPKEVLTAMLARAVQEEYPFLQQVLKLTQMVGPLRWANSYYLTAFLADRPMLTLPFHQLEQRFVGYYPGGDTTPYQRRGQLTRVMDESHIITGDKGEVSGDPHVTEQYFSEATTGGWQPAV